MGVPQPFKDWNAEAITKVRGFLERGESLAATAGQLSDSAWLLLSWCQRSKRRSVLAAAAKLRTEVGAIDFEILDFWRVLPELSGQTTGASWFEIQMSTRAIIRDTILRYANDAVQTVHDNQLRAIARATLWVSIVILVVSCRGAGAALAPLIPDRMVTPNAPSGQPPIDERGM